MKEAFWTIVHRVRIQDFFDIVIISTLIYLVLVWFRQAASRFVLLGIGVLGVVYALARYFQLYLTAVVLQGFFAIFLIALVVIFQEEIRRFFERLGVWGKSLRRAATFPASPDVDVLTQTVTALAQKRIGALIVIPADDPLDRHVEGGRPLDGLLSQAILESIFDPHSAGHDGAVVIDRGRIVKFGCHLPLSLNPTKFKQMGLRHTAALGLAERSDAFCIVVSEEHGTISIARETNIVTLSSAKGLREALEKFFQNRVAKEKSKRPRDRMGRNFWQKAQALFLALLLWLLFGSPRGFVNRNFDVVIEYRRLPAGWVIEDPLVTQAELTLKGPEQAFQLLDPNSLKIVVNLSHIKEGKQELALTLGMIQVPSNISIEEINPESIPVRAYKLVPAEATIQVMTKGTLPAGQALKQIEAMPMAISVLIQSTLPRKGLKVQTEPIDLGELTGTATLTPSLILPAGVHFVDGQAPPVRVTIEVQKGEEPVPPNAKPGS